MRFQLQTALQVLTRSPALGRQGKPSASKQHSEGFAVGRWRVRVAEGTLTDSEEVRRLEPRAMDVLAYLAQHPGRVISRQELVDQVWQGAAVTDGAITRNIVAIRRTLGDDAKSPRYVRTVPKRGYQLLTDSSRPSHPKRYRYIPTSCAAAAILMLVVLWSVNTARPVIAVQEFENLDAIAIDEGWAEGLTDELLSQLAALPDHDVIVNAAIDPPTQDHRLPIDADLLLTGTVRRQGDTVRVSCRTTTPETGDLQCASACTFDGRDRMAAQQLASQRILSGFDPGS